MFTMLFAVARTPGWIAQWKEMIEVRQPVAALTLTVNFGDSVLLISIGFIVPYRLGVARRMPNHVAC